MGVRQLETYVKKFVPHGYTSFSLIKACEEFKEQHNEVPILLLDFYGFLSVLQGTDEETLCGGRNNKLKKIFEKMLLQLSQFAELVFFIDGPVLEQKLETWIDRHGSNYNKCLEVMEQVYKGQPLKEIIESYRGYNGIPKFTMQSKMMEEMARKYGTLHVSFTRECDSEMVRYAINNPKVLAIVADDSDFLIYPGRWRYLSLKSIDYQTMQTYEYNRQALRSFLTLNDREMAILSTLNGNDIINFDDAQRKFHVTLHDFKYRFGDFRYPKLAYYARRISTMEQENAVNEISKLLGCSTKMVKESLDMYNPNFDVIESTGDPLQHFCLDKYFKFTYAILINSPIHYTCNYFDLAKNDIHDAKVELFQKQIGVVLANIPERTNADYQIITKRKFDEDYMVHHVQPELYHTNLPPLLEILDRSTYACHDDLRYELLKWMIDSDKLACYDLKTISPKYLQDVLTLFVLRKYGHIEEFEADLILKTIHDVEEKKMLTEQNVPSVLNEKAFRIAFLFSKFHGMIDNCFQVAGLKDISKPINFDGVLFHSLYLVHLLNPFDFDECLSDINHYRIYA